VQTTKREKEAHDEKTEIEVVEDVGVDLGSVILEHFGENDECGVVVALIHVRYIMAVKEP